MMSLLSGSNNPPPIIVSALALYRMAPTLRTRQVGHDAVHNRRLQPSTKRRTVT